jgi:hypothetical protein
VKAAGVDEVRMRVERRNGRYRVVDDTTGKIAADHQGVPLDDGGYRRKGQAKRKASEIESFARWALREPSTAAQARATAPVVVTAVDRDRGVVELGEVSA